MGERLRVVFDCNIFWRALFSPSGIGNKCLRLAKAGRVLVFTSDTVLAEVSEVVVRPETLKDFPSIDRFKIDSFIDEIRGCTTLVSSVPHVFEFARDPKDEAYIDLAAAVAADYLVTFDRDLLDLMTGYDA
jgi:putative PIN family toxin of toxin-antitoxin system